MRALLSVYDKTGIVELAEKLQGLGVELISSGGTARAIAGAGIPVTDVADFTGYPAMLGHRVVTLHPKVHGGILANRDDPEHMADLEKFEIETIDIVVGNLYPFASEPSIELIDIGGPTLVRGAAKNHAHVMVVVDPSDYDKVADAARDAIAANESITGLHFGAYLARQLARKAFAHTAAYDAEIVTWFDDVDAGDREYAGLPAEMPPTLHITAELQRTLGKGENGHQKPAAMYAVCSNDPFAPGRFELVEGNPGWVNWTDNHRSLITLTTMAAALEVNTGTDPTMLYALVVKHGNASGASYGRNPIEVLKRTMYGNLLSIHGGWLMVNFPIGQVEAECLRMHAIKDPAFKRIFAGVVAPHITPEAREILHRKNEACAMLVNPALAEINWESRDTSLHIRQIEGGFMAQPRSTFIPIFTSDGGMELEFALSMDAIPLLALAWAIGSTTISNTIALTGDQRLLGLGCGQQDRVGAAKLALERFAEANAALRELHLPEGELQGSAGYSDSFFPFPDGLLVLIEAGVPVIFASSGSVHDEDVRQAARDNGVNLVMLPDAQCRGFFGH